MKVNSFTVFFRDDLESDWAEEIKKALEKFSGVIKVVPGEVDNNTKYVEGHRMKLKLWESISNVFWEDNK